MWYTFLNREKSESDMHLRISRISNVGVIFVPFSEKDTCNLSKVESRENISIEPFHHITLNPKTSLNKDLNKKIKNEFEPDNEIPLENYGTGDVSLETDSERIIQSVTGQIFSKGIEITPQIHIRKFEEQMA